MFLGVAILDPEVTHSHGFGEALFYLAIGDANGGNVVASDMGRQMCMAHFCEVNSHWYIILAVVEHYASLGFRCGGKDNFEYSAVCVHCAVLWGRLVGGKWLSFGHGFWSTKDEMVALLAASLCIGEIGCSTVNVENHYLLVVADDGTWMGRKVVDQAGDCLVCALGGFGFLG